MANDRSGSSEGGERKLFSTVEAEFLAAGEAMDGAAEEGAGGDGGNEAAMSGDHPEMSGTGTSPSGWWAMTAGIARRRAREIGAGVALTLLIVGALLRDAEPLSPPARPVTAAAPASRLAEASLAVDPGAHPLTPARFSSPRPLHHAKAAHRALARR